MTIPSRRTAGLRPERRPYHCPGHPVPPSALPRPDPVLLLHGSAHDRAVPALLRRALHRDGWTHLHTLNHSPLTRDVHAAAVLLARHVEWAARAHGGRPVALVGYGPGGLIARHYVQHLDGHLPATTVVVLATPYTDLPAHPEAVTSVREALQALEAWASGRLTERHAC